MVFILESHVETLHGERIQQDQSGFLMLLYKVNTRASRRVNT